MARPTTERMKSSLLPQEPLSGRSDLANTSLQTIKNKKLNFISSGQLCNVVFRLPESLPIFVAGSEILMTRKRLAVNAKSGRWFARLCWSIKNDYPGKQHQKRLFQYRINMGYQDLRQYLQECVDSEIGSPKFRAFYEILTHVRSIFSKYLKYSNMKYVTQKKEFVINGKSSITWKQYRKFISSLKSFRLDVIISLTSLIMQEIILHRKSCCQVLVKWCTSRHDFGPHSVYFIN